MPFSADSTWVLKACLSEDEVYDPLQAMCADERLPM